MQIPASQMLADNNKKKPPGKIVRYAWSLAIFWTLCIGASCYWNVETERKVLLKIALAEASATIGRDMLYRRWGSLHGGVYVPVTSKTPPNPYLSHVTERDITTPSGRQLTLIKPDYMVRDIYELAEKTAPIIGQGRLTSLIPLRPENKPDPWEEKALRAFEAGTKEFSEEVLLDGKPFIRLMQPFVTEKSCLKCHAIQGHKEGDVWGGVSVTIPVQPLIDATRGRIAGILIFNCVIWLLGIGMIGLGARQLSRKAGAQKRIEDELHHKALDLEAEIAERKKVQDELEMVNHSLEERIEEDLAELRHKDQALIQQSRLAALGEMINNIAHQWRQPLNNVGLIIQNLQFSFNSGKISREEMDGEILKAMDIIMHMSRTIDDFRNFFREDKEKQDFFINNAVKRALEFVSAALKNRNIEVTIEAEEDVTTIGHQNEYSQVLLNIISNASEASIERCVTRPHIFIRITCENERSVVYIRDNCGGIPDDVMPRIFDPYFTTRSPDRGTGIGLYMSKVIIEQNMAGRLTARNLDGGAEFRVEV
jgi:signal transduction histidine kinase